MNIPVFIGVLLFLQIVCLIVAKRVSKKLDTQDDYFLAGRGVRFFPLMMTLIATQIGGGLILGSAEEAYRYGWYVLLYPMGASLGLMLLALGIGKRLSQFKVSTVAQLFEVVYRSGHLKRVASLLSIVSLFMILIAQVIASKKFMISLGVPQDIFFLAFWGIVIFYTVAGGLKAVVATDIIQAAFFIGVFLACFLYSFFAGAASVPDTLAITSMGDSFAFDPNKLWGWLLMPLLFMVIEQDMAQRCFAAKSGKVVSWATGWAALCILVVCAIPVYYGILGKTLGVITPEGGSVLMSVMSVDTTPTLTALAGCAILAAILSTADSLMNAISSNIAQDFDIKWGSNNRQVRYAQGITAVIGCAALFMSSYFSNIVDVLVQSYALSVSCLFIPVVAALFLNKGNPLSALLAIIAGAIGFFGGQFISMNGVPTEIVGVLFSLIGFGLGELLARVSEARNQKSAA